MSLHVTNTSYLAWAIEAVPRDVWRSRRLASLEVRYLAEVRYGNAILSRVAPTGGGAFAHALVSEEDERDPAHLVTAWMPR